MYCGPSQAIVDPDLHVVNSFLAEQCAQWYPLLDAFLVLQVLFFVFWGGIQKMADARCVAVHFHVVCHLPL